MQWFFAHRIEGEEAFFSVEEARHLAQVLRRTTGDEVHFVDGKGGQYVGIITDAGKRGARAKILQAHTQRPRPYQLHLAVAPTKNNNRLEWLLEKATELGVDAITPVICARSERTKVRPDRLERILLSAMKQSLQARMPGLRELQSLEAFLQQDHRGQGFIAWCGADDLPPLQHNYRQGEDVTLLIGPEGDFTPDEVGLAKDRGYVPVSLGPNRLRTETAALVACTIVNVMNQ